MPTLSKKAMRDLRTFLAASFGPENHWVAVLDRALVPDRAARVAGYARAEKLRLRRELVRDVRPRVQLRAAGICECGCGHALLEDSLLFEPHWDEVWGRGKKKSTVENTWLITARCHGEKTLNFPSRVFWLVRFEIHCMKRGYRDQLREVRRQIAWEKAKHGEAKT